MAKRSWAARAAYTAVTVPFTVLAVLFAVSNRHAVEVHLWPLPGGMDVPVYMLALLALLAGFLIGGIVTVCGGMSTWARARRAEETAAGLERQLEQAKLALPDYRAGAGAGD